MEFNRDNILNRSTTAKKAVVMDEGLRAYMLKAVSYTHLTLPTSVTV